ncbi:NAD(+)/NADH kinase [Saccharophagus degradans]|uniref:ATP-NAD kinase family protein n=1 Tax=Saccharophagus degradans TaxID=86304 RepID=UPI003A811353
MSLLPTFTLGFIINPLAGVGGEAGFKGSDAPEIQASAASGHLPLRAFERAHQFLQGLQPIANKLRIVTVPASMGADAVARAGLQAEVIDFPVPSVTSAKDTQAGVQALCAAKLDLLVFVGGDGTARDVCSVVGCESRQPQLAVGVPSGVKMHSGVYGIHPTATAQVVCGMVAGELTAVHEQEVRDIDEAAFRQGIVRSRYYGSMRVPSAAEFVQHVKQGGVEVEELVLLDIANEIKERLEAQFDDLGEELVLTIFAPGSTTQFVQQELGLPSTLLGVDVTLGLEPLAQDVNANQLAQLIDEHRQRCGASAQVNLVLTAIGGQGHLLGRGNQQLRADILQKIGREHLWPIATKAKLKALDGRPLILDTGNSALNRQWSGLFSVVTGYQDNILYRAEGA